MQSLAMRLLVAVALTRGIGPTSLAERLKCDRKTLYGYLNAESPHAATIKRFVAALDYGPRVARALMGQLSERDIRYLRTSVEVTIDNHADKLDARAARESVADIWRLPPDVQNEALAAYFIAFEGLSQEQPLSAFAEALMQYGYDFRDAFQVVTSPREAAIAFGWLVNAAALSAQQKQQVWLLIAPAVGGADHPALIEPSYEKLYKRARAAIGGQTK
jgi:hypothetical protein